MVHSKVLDCLTISFRGSRSAILHICTCRRKVPNEAMVTRHLTDKVVIGELCSSSDLDEGHHPVTFYITPLESYRKVGNEPGHMIFNVLVFE